MYNKGIELSTQLCCSIYWPCDQWTTRCDCLQL